MGVAGADAVRQVSGLPLVGDISPLYVSTEPESVATEGIVHFRFGVKLVRIPVWAAVSLHPANRVFAEIPGPGQHREMR